MTRPFFTVAIPTYNREKLLKFTLDAVLSQSFRDFEIIIYDNASSDGTRNFVAGYDTPRIKYFCQPVNVVVGQNFADMTAAATGEYVVLNQDDDLLHRDFLLRCHSAVTGRDDVAMYAAPVWREQRGRGYQARLLRSNDGYQHDFLLQDKIMYMDGTRMAVSMLNLIYYFLHPSIAIRRDVLVRAGGYTSRADCLPDILTEARVLMHGKLAYDPRPGAMYRDHDANDWKRYDRSLRKRLMAQTLHCILDELSLKGIPWEQHFSEELKGYSKGDLEQALKEWCWCGAPGILIRKGIAEIRQRSPWSSLKFNLWLSRKLGLKHYFKHGIR